MRARSPMPADRSQRPWAPGSRVTIGVPMPISIPISPSKLSTTGGRGYSCRPASTNTLVMPDDPTTPVPSDDAADVLAVGRSEVVRTVLSLSARHPDGHDARYLEWHMLDHLP